MNLNDFFQLNNKIALAFSGGVDSAYLLYAAVKAHADVKAYYVKSAFQPMFEYQDALKLAKELNAELEVINLDILKNEDIKRNPCNRCYFCKKDIFNEISEHAIKDGYNVLIDGTNASDDLNDRPGYKALKELNVLSPLRICNLTKDEIRKLSKEAGLFTFDKPAYACLATRVKTDEEITEYKLQRIEKAEEYLKTVGFKDFRVRTDKDLAKIQLKENDFLKLFDNRKAIYKALGEDFTQIVLDLKERL